MSLFLWVLLAAVVAVLAVAVFTDWLKGWRTVLTNTLAAIPLTPELTSGLAEFLNAKEVAEVIPGPWVPWYMVGVLALNIALRCITTTPVGRNA